MPLSPGTRDKIVAVLKLGMPLSVAADWVEIELSVVKAEMSRDREFRKKVRKAIADCLHARLEVLQGLKNWQAIAFILESLWPRQFGRSRRRMPKAAARRISSSGLDFSRLTPGQQHQLDELLAIVHGQQRLLPDPSDGSGPQIEGRAESD
jgi:hypothetical protein